MADQSNTCHACTIAKANPFTGSFQASCKQCSARGLAQSPEAWRAMQGETAEPLQDAIRGVWGDEYEAGRQMVWEWIQRLNAAKAAKG